MKAQAIASSRVLDQYRHVRHRQSHLWSFPSRPACSDIYIDLMSHLSLTERGMPAPYFCSC